MQFRHIHLACLLWWAISQSLMAATYYTVPGGNDANAGTLAQPWRTIQKGANTVVAGDTLIVQAGTYDEYVRSARGGTGPANRIHFRAEGEVVLRGWQIAHPYVTVEGFQITGHSANDVYSAHVEITAAADHCQLLNNIVRDGVHLARPDMRFASNHIISPGGGFLAGGFRPGQTIYLGQAADEIPLKNTGLRTVLDVTDDTLKVAGTFVEDGPIPAYISGSYVYGLVVRNGAEQCLVRSNRFQNLSFDTWFVGGLSNRYEYNTIAQTHGWDAIHFMGTNNIFSRNFLHSSPLIVYQVSPDAFENWAPSPYSNILFESNFVQGFKGVFSSQKGSAGNMDRLVLRNNVFVDVGRFVGRYPHTFFENNTFLYAAATNTPLTSVAPHPIKFEGVNLAGTVIRNNIFVACGQGKNPDLVGWYEFAIRPDSAEIGPNFVCGPAPGFSAKTNFNEGVPGLNGGEPGFADIRNPLGPDGLPFTDDDGLRLLPTSKLAAAGAGGMSLGAYQVSVPPTLTLILDSAKQEVELSWSMTAENQILQAKTSISDAWSDLDYQPQLKDGAWRVGLGLTNAARFFRLKP